MPRLDNKVAVVFGAGPNIGGTIAHFLAKEGAKVVVNDISQSAADETVKFLNSRNCEGVALAGDATLEEDVVRIIDEATKRFGHVDVVVNLAGNVVWGEVTQMSLQDFSKCVLSFLSAGFLTTKYGARAMIEQSRKGSIIQLLSTAAHFGEAGSIAYCSAKAGLMNLARSAAMDLAHLGIRVNTITPCSVEHQLWTRMKDEVVKEPPPRTRSFYSRDDYLKMIPMARFTRASDIASAAVFLASDESEFMTGIDLPVDGGLRVKYPTWRPGDFTGANIEDYLKSVQVTRYGEPVGKYWDTVKDR
ncbi:MAG: SDR family oxidoreductase [Deltaproteobacteria bacterium]|nr:SDR family oxidoreductase [Deltaproteobacteria bacterium]